jgi:hypothetical protein
VDVIRNGGFALWNWIRLNYLRTCDITYTVKQFRRNFKVYYAIDIPPEAFSLLVWGPRVDVCRKVNHRTDDLCFIQIDPIYLRQLYLDLTSLMYEDDLK